VLGSLDAARIVLDADPGVPPPWFDCDTDEDLATARGTT
jgi:hypothetical protein